MSMSGTGEHAVIVVLSSFNVTHDALHHHFRVYVVPVSKLGPSLVEALRQSGGYEVVLPILVPNELQKGEQMSPSIQSTFDAAVSTLNLLHRDALDVLSHSMHWPMTASDGAASELYMRNALSVSGAYLRIEYACADVGFSLPDAGFIASRFSTQPLRSSTLKASSWFLEVPLQQGYGYNYATGVAAANPFLYIVRPAPIRQERQQTYLIQLVEYENRMAPELDVPVCVVERCQQPVYYVTQAFFHTYFGLFSPHTSPQPGTIYFMDGRTLLCPVGPPSPTDTDEHVRCRLVDSLLSGVNVGASLAATSGATDVHVVTVTDNRLAVLLADLAGYIRIRVWRPQDTPGRVYLSPKPVYARQSSESMSTRAVSLGNTVVHRGIWDRVWKPALLL